MRIAATLAFALLLLPSYSADIAHQDALNLLAAGNFEAAEVAVRKAIEDSLRFDPQQEIGSRPAKGLLFENMILEARLAYRERRARYFRTLGDALAGQKQWRASRKAYSRAVGIVPDHKLWSLMANDMELEPSERLELLLQAYLAAAGTDRTSLEKTLIETGAFRSRDALKASLDQRRIATLQSEFEDLELVPGAFPNFQVATNVGNLVTTDLFRAGNLLVTYFPVDSCGRCSEELASLSIPVLELQRTGLPIEVAAFVTENDLPIARRIVRLLGMRVSVARSEGLPSTLNYLEHGEIRVVARGGLTQIRIEMSPTLTGPEIRRRVDAIFQFLNEPGLPTEETPEEASVPLVTLERRTNERHALFEWIDKIEWLEAGPAPLEDIYRSLNSLTQRVVRGSESRGLGLEILTRLSRLQGANGAKLTALGSVSDRLGDRLLERAKELDNAVRRSASGEQGTLFVDVSSIEEGETGARIYLQRVFQTPDERRHIEFAVRDIGTELEIVWAAPQKNELLGVEAIAGGGVFHYRVDDECPRGLRFLRGESIAYESCEAIVFGDDIVELRRAVVDDIPNAPMLYRYNVVSGAEPTSLELGLRQFAEGRFNEASSTFEKAFSEVDPVAPYDASDVLYNLARTLEGQGKRQDALAAYRSLGDVHYQKTVDEQTSRIESGR